MKPLLATLAALFVAGAALAQCGSGSCSPESRAPAEPEGWSPCTVYKGCWRYVSNRQYAALYDPADGSYWLNNGSGLQKQSKPPVGMWPLPVAAQRKPEQIKAEPVAENYGIDLAQMTPGPPFTVNGKPVSTTKAFEIIMSGELTDDAHKPRLTIIGTQEQRKKVLADLESSPALLPYKDKLHLQAYSPDNWAVKGCGFKTDGQPTIYLQTCDGKTLHRQDDYSGGPEALAKAIGRKADPNYDPKKDPDGRVVPLLPGLPSLPDFDVNSIPPWGWLAAIGAAFLFFGRQSSQEAQQ